MAMMLAMRHLIPPETSGPSYMVLCEKGLHRDNPVHRRRGHGGDRDRDRGDRGDRGDRDRGSERNERNERNDRVSDREASIISCYGRPAATAVRASGPMRPPPLSASPANERRFTGEVAVKREAKQLLNKLTADKFEDITEKLGILLEGVSNASELGVLVAEVYQKAIKEPNFSEMYADVVTVLRARSPSFPMGEKEGGTAIVDSPVATGVKQTGVKETGVKETGVKETGVKETGVKETGAKDKPMTFARDLITKVQRTFERIKNPEAAGLDEEEGARSGGRRKGLLLEGDEDAEATERRNLLGNMRFIGELCLRGVLPATAFRQVIHTFIEDGAGRKPDERVIECTIELLTTVGEGMESKHISLQPVFDKLAEWQTSPHVVGRLKFLLQDLQDLRNNKWEKRAVYDRKLKLQEGKAIAGTETQFNYKPYVKAWDDFFKANHARRAVASAASGKAATGDAATVVPEGGAPARAPLPRTNSTASSPTKRADGANGGEKSRDPNTKPLQAGADKASSQPVQLEELLQSVIRAVRDSLPSPLSMLSSFEPRDMCSMALQVLLHDTSDPDAFFVPDWIGDVFAKFDPQHTRTFVDTYISYFAPSSTANSNGGSSTRSVAKPETLAAFLRRLQTTNPGLHKALQARNLLPRTPTAPRR